MVVLVVIALAIATVSAGIVPQDVPMHPRDMPAVTPIQGRITNGIDAAKGDIYYQVGLGFSGAQGSWWCGGSIISDQWVLSAAHCTVRAFGVTIYYGAVQRTVAELILTVSRDNFVQHADYNAQLHTNDIALIKTSVISFNAFINKISLPSASDTQLTFAGNEAKASGWGRTSDAATGVTEILQYEIFKVIPNNECANYFGSIITNKIICVATPDQKSTCNGDSGGPLVLVDNKKLIGITSFGSNKGCQLGFPAAFTRVTSYLEWIKQISGVSS